MDDLEIYELIMSKDFTWEGLLRDIVKKEDINPWDIDISFLADKYKEALSKLKSVDFRLSGKFLLASAILLRMKSDRFNVEEMRIAEDYFDDFFDDMNFDCIMEDLRNEQLRESFKKSKVEVNLNLPQRRAKPISIDDLVEALKEAMIVKERRESRRKKIKESLNYHANIVKIDITAKIREIYSSIVNFFDNMRREEITFKELLPSQDRKDVLWTFVPLLHLNNEGKINLYQKVQFGEIKIKRPFQKL